ncbi:hypothetical protein GCM10025782_13050 [Pedococcus ginsenosidimutans]|uniref:Putative endonuclease Z1 domain-containing protein n=1 Tax=Pedococcus ginsenosidimutans TaxID=490570 RepID=A0ABP8XZ88_9MICO
MTEQVETLRNVVTAAMAGGVHSEEELRSSIAMFRSMAMFDGVSDEESELLFKQLTKSLLIELDLGVAVTSSDFEPWLDSTKASIDWRRWKTYKQWLLQSGRPPRVVERLDELTDAVLELAGSPTTEGTWARRGLVIGDVQSGKTGTYLGLFNKAVDAGYRLIIVLAGSTESLRQQTQTRVDEGLIGRDSRGVPKDRGVIGQKRFVGVGRLNQTIADGIGMTTIHQDFRKTSLLASNHGMTTDSPAPYVFVVKKNKTVLTHLQSWLDTQVGLDGKLALPLLLLDDESDYASVNTNADTNPTAVNDAIRGVLGKFSRSSYVAFTATPFANIFIDHDQTDDLFPRDYVYSLETPTNYVGAERTFGTADEPRDSGLLDPSDAESYFPRRHKADLHVNGLPESLRHAVRAFLLTCAIRDARQQGGGRSMLVNVSRFKEVQRQCHELVEAYTVELKQAIEFHAEAYANGSPNEALAALEETFEEFFADAASWTDLVGRLQAAVSDVRVELINSDRDKKLTDEEIAWDRPPRMIAVGGDVLSRGLTLDGLSTSYFYRQAGAFDTLLQMGRWFGYRDGYEDLTKIWIDPLVVNHFRFVAAAVEELRGDLESMKAARLTPADFGLAVKKHPDSLLVTARNKMRNATTFSKSVSLGGRRLETTRLNSAGTVIDQNFGAFEQLVSSIELSSAKIKANRRNWSAWSNVPKALVGDFLAAYTAYEQDTIFTGTNLSSFVGGATSPSLQTWDVVIANGPSTALEHHVGGVGYRPPSRSILLGDGHILVSGRSSRLAGPSDVAGLLPLEAEHEVRTAYIAAHSDLKNAPETAYYKKLSAPTLIIYPLRVTLSDRAPKSKDQQDFVAKELEPRLLTAVKIAIPGDAANVRDRDKDAEYMINTVAQKQWIAELGSDVDED